MTSIKLASVPQTGISTDSGAKCDSVSSIVIEKRLQSLANWEKFGGKSEWSKIHNQTEGRMHELYHVSFRVGH